MTHCPLAPKFRSMEARIAALEGEKTKPVQADNPPPSVRHEAMADNIRGGIMEDITTILRMTTERMAHQPIADMELWNEHSNAVLQAARDIDKLRAALEKICDSDPSVIDPFCTAREALGISKTALYNYCPGGRAGLAVRDAAKKELIE